MSARRIHTIVLGLLLSLVLIGTARSAINGGGDTGGGDGEVTCARCGNEGTCAGGYASGGTDCIVQCKWNPKKKDFGNCSCYTVGDCPGSGGSSGGGSFMP